MQQNDFIKRSTLEEVKNHVQKLYETKREITVNVKKTRSKTETYHVSIEGVYQTFFTVKNDALNANFTIQYIDILTGSVTVSE